MVIGCIQRDSRYLNCFFQKCVFLVLDFDSLLELKLLLKILDLGDQIDLDYFFPQYFGINLVLELWLKVIFMIQKLRNYKFELKNLKKKSDNLEDINKESNLMRKTFGEKKSKRSRLVGQC